MTGRFLVSTALVVWAAGTCFAQSAGMQLVTPSTGWWLTGGRLLRTDTGGREWSDITPASAGQGIDGAFFLDAMRGWSMVEGRELALTLDGGRTWSVRPLEGLTADDVRSYGGQAAIQFVDAQHGWVMLRRSSSSNFSLGVLLATVDGGETWRRLPDPPIGDPVRFVSTVDGWLTGGPAGDEVYATHDGGETWTREAQTVAPARGEGIIDRHFVTPSEGWLLVGEGKCAGEKTGCRQAVSLFRTDDGGATRRDITPSIALTAGTRPPRGPLASSPGEGFDKCTADTVANMQTWWTSSPFFDVNIYIGGASRACAQPNLTKDWVTRMLGMGWRLIPTWVGPQAPCNAFTRRISTDPLTADSQGAAEAQSASDAAAALGLTSTVIYYDMEYYSPSDQQCDAAIKGFVNGWVRGMHARHNVAGFYGSPLDAGDWATVANPPDAVWLAKWDNRDTVFGLTPVGDNAWPHRRLHQYMGGHNEVWGGVTFNIDRDVEFGPVVVAMPGPRAGGRPGADQQ